MNQIQKIRAILIAVSMLFSSCSKLIHGHQDFLSKLKTMNDVTAHFGIPDQYQELADTTKWLYDLKDQQKLTPGNPDPVSLTIQNKNPKKMDSLLYPHKFLYVAFKKDSVIKLATRDVNFKLRKPQPWKTVALLSGSFAIGYVFVTLLAVMFAFSGG